MSFRMITAVLLRAAIFGALTLSVSAHAQDVDEGVLDEIVVTATRIESTVRDAGRSISVVGKDRIQLATQQLGLDEALAGIPGLYMQNRYNFAQDLRISLRGFGARSSFGIRGIKVIVDGVPETLPDGQAGVDSIDLGSAQSIEVLRGPASSLYGNASGGVISVLSELGSEHPYIQGRIAGGDFNYRQVQLKSAGNFGVNDYLFNVSHNELGGYRDHSHAKGSVINTKLRIPMSDTGKLLISLNITDQPEAQDPGGINAAQAATDPSSARDRNIQFDSGEALEQQRLGLVYKRMAPAGNLTLRNYYAWREFSNKLPFVGGGSVDLDRFFFGAGVQYDFSTLPAGMSLAVGMDYDRQDDKRQRFDNNDGILGPMVFDQNETVDSLGLFAQSQYAFSNEWSVLAGLRYDEVSYDVTDSYFANGDDSGRLDFDQLSPSVGLNYRTNYGAFFASYSSSFETPTTTELANPDASGGFNPGLDPQLADNLEIGFKYSKNKLFYELTWFTINIEDELIPFELEEFPGRRFFSNAGDSDRDGIEASLSWEHENGLRVDASYTWSDFKFDHFLDDNGNDYSGKQLPGLPEHFGYLGFSYRSEGGVNGTFEVIYSGDLFTNNANTADVSSYSVANLRFAREFSFDRWMIRPYAGINNLLDERYNSNIRVNAWGGRYYEPAPERHLYAGVVVNFRN